MIEGSLFDPAGEVKGGNIRDFTNLLCILQNARDINLSIYLGRFPSLGGSRQHKSLQY